MTRAFRFSDTLLVISGQFFTFFLSAHYSLLSFPRHLQLLIQ
jgi:hypothetical protein